MAIGFIFNSALNEERTISPAKGPLIAMCRVIVYLVARDEDSVRI
jgi:hypothetical protein